MPSRPFLRLISRSLVLVASMASGWSGTASAANQITDAEAVAFLMEMQEVFRSRDSDQLVAFVQNRYTDDVTIGLTVNLSMIGQDKPVVQKATLTKAEQIEQFRQAAPLYAKTSDYEFSLTVKDVLVEPGGGKARALYEAKESAIFDAHTADGTPVTVRHRTAARCSVMIVPTEAEPKISQLDCVYNTTADQP